jgi:hypothetical protein
MTDPADRTYPTTVTNTYIKTKSDTSAVTIDQVTVLDPWPTSPDPEAVPFTMKETEITQRTISPTAGVATTLSMTVTSTWILWTTSFLDMPPSSPPECPGPGGCSYPSVKPHPRCRALSRETRCAAQCTLKDWMWWCKSHAELETNGPVGRVCSDGNSTDYEYLLEPCDHTDFKPGCPLCPEYEEVEE